ncbi:MAG: EF2563 family selenium-dependent molybdenum hydroxylase system protein [Anaerolineae bacterium]|nr:EF2563 family selenium-dependent molybdenum hydroxylase system protein [Anaerolineae bacterium]
MAERAFPHPDDQLSHRVVSCAYGLVVIRGAGDLATGVAHRLHRCGFHVVMTEIAQPRALRRAVSFASAVYEGSIAVEGVTARLVGSAAEAMAVADAGEVAVLVDPDAREALSLRPEVLVDAIMAKRNLGTHADDAPIVIGLGPGFVAGKDVHSVVETARGHHLGRLIVAGSAEPDTGVPGAVHGYARERVLWSPADGVFVGLRRIGEPVRAGDPVARVGDALVCAEVGGVLRGLLHDGLAARAGEKVGDVDPRGVPEYCTTISDKARAIAGGVLEGILFARRHPASR